MVFQLQYLFTQLCQQKRGDGIAIMRAVKADCTNVADMRCSDVSDFYKLRKCRTLNRSYCQERSLEQGCDWKMPYCAR